MGNRADNEIPNSVNIMVSGTVIHGDVETQGDFRVDGTVLGNFTSKLKVVIGPTGYIEGDIECGDCEVFGKVKGNILAHEHLILRENSEVCGDIRINRITIEPGAMYSGHCSMLNAQPSPEPDLL